METSRYRLTGQRGSAAVEFALVALIRFGFIFGTIEVARIIYLWSTMTEVTNQAARAASMTNFNDTIEMTALRQRAMFLTGSNQKLILGGAITDTNLQIDYLMWDARTKVGTPPTCVAQNIVNCLNDPKAANCVRFVRVRLCKTIASSGDCNRVPYEPFVALPGIDKLGVNMPWFTAIAPVETMGTPGACS